MAAILTYVSSRHTPRTDELCPSCFCPSLKLHVLTRIDLEGLAEVGERMACRDEKKWVTELKEYAPHGEATTSGA